jgi:hypothetical protein
MDALKPLKAAIKRLKGRGNSGRFGCIAEVILVFKYNMVGKRVSQASE